MTKPLSRLKVVEMAGLGPCPLAGQLLADLGADVTVIDRKSGRRQADDINRRGKRSIALDLKSAAGLQVAKRLIGKADILIEGFRPGVMEKLTLGPDVLLKENPRLIFGRMTGWGQDGPLASTAGHDINYLSITGALFAIGPAERPVPPLNLAADYGGGTMFLIFGILSAVIERQTSGLGQVVDAAMVDGVPALMGLIHTFYARQQWVLERQKNLLDGGTPFYRCYETRDGRHMSVGALEPQFFAELVARLGLQTVDVARQSDPTTWPAMEQAFAETFRQKTMAEWTAHFEGSDACVAPVLNFEEAALHPHNLHRGNLQRKQGVLQAAPAPRFSRSSLDIPSVAPGGPGGDWKELLEEAGYDTAEIDNLRASGALS